MASIFSKIVKGEIPSYKVAENEEYLAFLDAFPLRRGHTLVIPKKELDQLFDLDPQTYTGLLDFSRKIALALKAAIPCNRISMQVIGLEVPHVHIHLIPINSMRDCDFSREKMKFSREEFTATAALIASKIKLKV